MLANRKDYPGVLGCRHLRRYRSSTLIGRQSRKLPRDELARWHAHLRGLTPVIHEISGLAYFKIEDKRMFVNRKDYFLGGRVGVLNRRSLISVWLDSTLIDVI